MIFLTRISSVLAIITLCTAPGYLVNDKEVEETEYILAYVSSEKSPKTYTLCDLPKPKKLAICKMILEQYAHEYGIYFNKVAAFHLTPDCETKILTFEINTRLNDEPRTKQEMFPCYGRHNPVRTYWKTDDYFDFIYVSGTLKKDSLLIYFHTKVPPNDDIYSIRGLLMDANIADLPEVIVTENEANEESKLNKRISFNSNQKEVENYYIREVVNGEKIKLDPICELDVAMKLKICKILLQRDLYRNQHNWSINEPAFKTQSVECEKQKLVLKHYTYYNFRQRITNKMFPCFGKSLKVEDENRSENELVLTKFSLSGGSRLNSVIVYITEDGRNYSLYEFIENVHLESLSYEIKEINNRVEVEMLYIKSFIDTKHKPNNLCDLPKEQKLAICNAIIQLQTYRKSMNIFFNKAAAFYKNPDCEENIVISQTDLEFDDQRQQMFPCYGRHDPMRTNWNIDDYFDIIYLSVGTEIDSIFVYLKQKTIEWDTYTLHSLITNMKIDFLEPLNVNEDEAKEELKSLKQMTINIYRKEIETIYIREIINNKIAVRDRLCNLPKEKKLLLCKTILEERLYVIDWVVDEEAFFSKPTDCVSRFLKFHTTKYYMKPVVSDYQRMFPCYGESTGSNIGYSYYLSGSYRKNSVVVYGQHPTSYFYNPTIDAFFENVYLGFCPTTKKLIKDLNRMEYLYVTFLIEKRDKPDTLCDLPARKKMAICSAILEHYPDIYFNKAAHFFRDTDCVENSLTFRNPIGLMYQNSNQKMFPCYGRHDPLRTSWYEDFFADSFYISGGPEYDSLFVYIRSIGISGDWFGIYELITDAGIDYMPSVSKIYVEELIEESRTLERLSISENWKEIESFYAREIIFKEISIKSDPVCDLPAKKKLSLCKIILQNLPKYKDYHINEDTFGYQWSIRQTKYLRFRYTLLKHLDSQITRAMIPCRGQYVNNVRVTVFYLCAGIRKNSVFVFKDDTAYYGTSDIVKLVASIENLDLSKL